MTEGANASNGTNAGLFTLNGNNAAGNANVNNGAALTRSLTRAFPPSPHLSVKQMQGASIAPSRPPRGPKSAELERAHL